jgi:hypothetical protein
MRIFPPARRRLPCLRRSPLTLTHASLKPTLTLFTKTQRDRPSPDGSDAFFGKEKLLLRRRISLLIGVLKRFAAFRTPRMLGAMYQYLLSGLSGPMSPSSPSPALNDAHSHSLTHNSRAPSFSSLPANAHVSPDAGSIRQRVLHASARGAFSFYSPSFSDTGHSGNQQQQQGCV